jgi:hypothetical protein
MGATQQGVRARHQGTNEEIPSQPKGLFDELWS